jgi:hypothetical protein
VSEDPQVHGVDEQVVSDQPGTARLREREVDVDQDGIVLPGHIPYDVVQRRRGALRQAIEITRQAEPLPRVVRASERPLAGRYLELEVRERVVDHEGSRPGGQRPLEQPEDAEIGRERRRQDAAAPARIVGALEGVARPEVDEAPDEEQAAERQSHHP